MEINQTNKQLMEEVREKQSLGIVFKSLKDAEQKRGLKIGIYGDYATGKTHFGLTSPTPIYIIDTENGAPPLAFNFKDKDIRVLDVGEIDGVVSFENDYSYK